MKANEFIIAPENAGKSIVEIMQLYSDQQNKELREQYPIKLHGWEISPETEPNALKAGIKFKAVCDSDVKSGESVNELIQEIAEETDDYFWKATDGFKSEIQRLTKEVEELKSRIENLKWVRENDTRPAELTRLRELLEKIMAYFDDGTIVRDTSRDGDSDFHERMISFVKLLTEIDNALNHKPRAKKPKNSTA